MILFESGFVNENEVVDFERREKCFVSVVFNHGFACFYEMIASEREKFCLELRRDSIAAFLDSRSEQAKSRGKLA